MENTDTSFQVFLVVINQIMIIFGLLCHVVGKCSSVLEECTAFNSKVIELFQADAAAIWRLEMCQLCRTV